jgi:hypothetical protein
MEIYEVGKNLGSFNYLNEYDPDGIYIGYFIEYGNMVYQIIVNQNNVLLDPEGNAVPFAPSLQHANNEALKKSKEPIKVETHTVSDDYFNNQGEFHKINYDIVDEKMENLFEETFLNENSFENEFDNFSDSEYQNENVVKNKVTDIKTNVINFNTPW